ncbi:uncharacterized protein KLLA0_C12034g [Kluyveromyces lactis]|uniref:KLLA0C12034p n=1 Tax=Kluyveromyces lactis (strain ATCC 8585 / CBS 2359 / DSM 70799 / NBRC 1267 / NRRL Y-1140 / WM37) TaxID=284590 RepID=B5FV61_KLULA|nr:uncharacterized protein KLLA0_C12034g [Kluyveromyces lactis]CAR64363.1 KLLA0C12034p [Kluyveromyces lactis]|eukprot:XP_002999359.1 uncharacterized protein KLLA0_C12034g [Kluyveromyces lactis]
MVELSTPVKSWNFLRKQNCNRRVAGSIPVRFIFNFFISSTSDRVEMVNHTQAFTNSTSMDIYTGYFWVICLYSSILFTK